MRWLCRVVGNIAMVILPSRRRLVMSNLYHAFPGRDKIWYQKICKINFSRLIELGLLGLSAGFWSENKIRSNFKLTQMYRKVVKEMANTDNGAIVLIPHFSLMEAMVFLPKIIDDPNFPDIGVIYRPLANSNLNKFIKKTRERFGLKLISRKDGIFETIQILRRGGIISLLVDQNAGEGGYRMLFFNRIISSTNLPSLLFDKFKSPVYFLYPRRVGFWKANIVFKRLKFDETDSKTILFATNKYLENLLTNSDEVCADWLWAHDRWKISNNVVIATKPGKKNWISDSKIYSGKISVERNFTVVIRMPNWLGDVIMAVPILRTLKSVRDDIRLILICQKQFSEFLNALRIADQVIELPAKDIFFFKNILNNKTIYGDVYISLVNSLRGDLEAVLMACPHRIGINTKSRFYRKFFINHLYDGLQESGSIHQTVLWWKMLNNFGFDGKLVCTPFRFCTSSVVKSKTSINIGIVAGSHNGATKRWPSESWKVLIERIVDFNPNIHVNLYGSKSDSNFTEEIALYFNRSMVSNFVGQTSILEFANHVQMDDLVIAIDSGGMHLANMFGRPLICLYGPTNPIVTGPIFDSPATILMPESCPKKGGFPIENIEIDTVLQAVKSRLSQIPKS